jgi:hypothetical protein
MIYTPAALCACLLAACVGAINCACSEETEGSCEGLLDIHQGSPDRAARLSRTRVQTQAPGGCRHNSGLQCVSHVCIHPHHTNCYNTAHAHRYMMPTTTHAFRRELGPARAHELVGGCTSAHTPHTYAHANFAHALVDDHPPQLDTTAFQLASTPPHSRAHRRCTQSLCETSRVHMHDATNPAVPAHCSDDVCVVLLMRARTTPAASKERHPLPTCARRPTPLSRAAATHASLSSHHASSPPCRQQHGSCIAHLWSWDLAQ